MRVPSSSYYSCFYYTAMQLLSGSWKGRRNINVAVNTVVWSSTDAYCTGQIYNTMSGRAKGNVFRFESISLKFLTFGSFCTRCVTRVTCRRFSSTSCLKFNFVGFIRKHSRSTVPPNKTYLCIYANIIIKMKKTVIS